MTSLPPTECINLFLHQAQRLGIEVRWARNVMNELNASYHARPGKPGFILLHDREPRPTTQEICTLITHEMVHVLQHWKGHLNAVPPLGWPTGLSPSERNLSRQEQEAYTAQSKPRKVLRAVKLLQPIPAQDSR